MKSFPACLTLLFITLKLTGVINWSWLWCWSPMLVVLGILLVMIFVMGLLSLIAHLLK